MSSWAHESLYCPDRIRPRYFLEALRGIFCPPDPIPGTSAADVGKEDDKDEVVTYDGKTADCTQEKYQDIKKYFDSMDYLKFGVGTNFYFCSV